jgi:hypothetical protein
MIPTATLVDQLDDRLFQLLHRPRMHARAAEALFSAVVELLYVRCWATGAEPFVQTDLLRRMDVLEGPVIRFPERPTDAFVERLRHLAIALGHQPGDRPARAAAWRAHWDACASCRRSDHCDEGKALWAACDPSWHRRTEAPQRGDRVRYRGSDEAEHGVVVHTWTDDATAATDCHVAFYGTTFPEGRPRSKPYVLRYLASSLEVVDGG